MHLRLRAAALLWALLSSAAVSAAPAQATIDNQTHATACAE